MADVRCPSCGCTVAWEPEKVLRRQAGLCGPWCTVFVHYRPTGDDQVTGAYLAVDYQTGYTCYEWTR